MGILTGLTQGDVLFIDEIHRMPSAVEEFLYPAMEDYRVDFVVDSGPMARTINFPLKIFTTVGATTRPGALTAALRERFYLVYHVDFYSEDELAQILLRSAVRLEAPIEEEAARELILQAGAFGEHRFGTVKSLGRTSVWPGELGGYAGPSTPPTELEERTTEVNSTHCAVTLPPGDGDHPRHGHRALRGDPGVLQRAVLIGSRDRLREVPVRSQRLRPRPRSPDSCAG